MMVCSDCACVCSYTVLKLPGTKKAKLPPKRSYSVSSSLNVMGDLQEGYRLCSLGLVHEYFKGLVQAVFVVQIAKEER